MANLKHVRSDKIEIMNREVLKLYDLFNMLKILIYNVFVCPPKGTTGG